MERLKNIFYSIQDFFSDSKIDIKVIGQILISVIMIIAFLGVPLGWYDEKSTQTSNYAVGDMNVSANIEDFDIIYIQETSKNEKYSVPKVALVFKEPTIDSQTAKTIMKYVLIQLINKAKNEEKQLIAFEILSYNNLFYYEMGYQYDGYFSSYINGSLYSSSEATDVDKKYDIFQTAKLEHKPFKEKEDIIVYDKDKIEITKIETPSYWSDEELIRFLKIEEYNKILKNQKAKAVEFYITYDLGLEKGSLKYKNYYTLISKEYNNYESMREKKPVYDLQNLIIHYRENYSDIWSNIVIFRGY